MDAVSTGQQYGGFVMFAAEDGRRYAVRFGAVLASSDVDEDRGTAVVQLPGVRAVLVYVLLEKVLSWFG